MTLSRTTGSLTVTGSMERLDSYHFSLMRGPKLMTPTVSLWVVFSTTLALTSLFVTGVSGQNGFISINCAGTGFTDSDNKIVWLTDEDYLDSAKQLAKDRVTIPANVNLDNSTAATRDNPEMMKTAMVFIPSIASPSKYCYNVDVDRTSNYLVRAMFPTSNLTAQVLENENLLTGYSTRFYFTVDSTFVSTVELNPKETQTVELVATPLGNLMYICLLPLEDRSSMAAISSIELRPLDPDLYLDGREASSESEKSSGRSNTGLRTSYLLTVARLNFGGNESSPAIRFPVDSYDRLWYPARNVQPDVTSRTTTAGNLGTFANADFPTEVVQSAWEGLTNSSNISFTFNIGAARSVRPIPSFYFTIYFYDVNPGEIGQNREVNVFLEDGGLEVVWGADVSIVSTSPWVWWYDKQTFSGDSSIFRIVPTESSILPAMINALELYGEFEAETQRTLETDDETIKLFSGMFGDLVDTAGDPCLPVPWNWLICSHESPPRITQINLTGKSANGTLISDFGSLNRLTVLDLSNNSFSDNLPPSLVDVLTLRELNVADNRLFGDLPQFKEKTSLVNLEILSLRNNAFTGDLLSLFNAFGPTSPVFSIDLSVNKFTGSIPKDIGHLKKLKFLDLSFNQLVGELDSKLVNLQELRTLSLQGNKLKGVVPQEIWGRDSKLQTVDLSDNKFEELDLTTWCLTVLDHNSLNAFQQKVSLVRNDIRRVILPHQDRLERLPRPDNPSSWIKNSSFILLGDNPWCKSHGRDNLAGRYLCRSSEYVDFWATDDNGASTRGIIIGTVIGGSLVLVMGCILLLVLRRTWKRMIELRQIQEALAKEDVRPPFFKYEDLKTASGEFSEENELGKGAFGAVYKGVLADGSIVAVKLLFPTEQNIADFLKEMVLITGIKHRHLIQLKGCCVRDRKRLLIYEYAENKNLAEALWGNKTGVKLTWAQRLKICVGIARGLCYLHEELQPRIIHRDIKAQNILLDKDWDAKIADFGLARPVEENSTMLATRIGGTLGYFSPEYATHGKLTEKLDVFSFGVLVLEILAGRQCIDLSLTSTPDQIYLKDWAFQLYVDGKILNVVEKDLLTTAPEEQILTVLKTALSCLHENHEKRPAMSQVVNILSGSSTEDVAVDILGQLKDQERMYEGLFTRDTIIKPNGKRSREDSALLQSSMLLSTSSSDPQRLIELTVTKPR